MKKTNIFIIIGSFVISACGGGGGDSTPAGNTGGNTDGNKPIIETPIGDVSGEWEITITKKIVNNSCPDAKDSVTKSLVDITLNGHAVTLTATQNGITNTITSSISGNKITNIDKSDVESSKTVLTVGPACNSTTGRTDWVFNNGNVACEGFETSTATRTIQLGCGKVGPGGLFDPKLVAVSKKDGMNRNIVNLKWNNVNSQATTTELEYSVNNGSNYLNVLVADFEDNSTALFKKFKIFNLPENALVFFRVYEGDKESNRSPYSKVLSVTTCLNSDPANKVCQISN